MKKVIKVTEMHSQNRVLSLRTILVGVESIISVQPSKISLDYGSTYKECTKIESRHAMVTHFDVTESVEEIYRLINE